MPITKEDIEKITPEELELIKNELKLKTQSEVDKAYGKGKEAGMSESKDKIKDYDKLQAKVEKMETEKKQLENDKLIQEKITSLNLKLNDEDKKKFMDAVGGDPEKVENIASLMGATKNDPEPDPFKGNGEQNPEPKKEPNKNLSAKTEDGKFIDEALQAMNERW